MLTLATLQPGCVLERVGPPLTQAAFSAFGLLLGTNAPIHDDPAYARATGFGGTIAQGMLLTAPYETWLFELFGETAWSRGGHIAVRFRSPAWEGERVVMTMTVRDATEGGCAFDLESRCGDRTLLTGSASVAVGP